MLTLTWLVISTWTDTNVALKCWVTWIVTLMLGVSYVALVLQARWALMHRWPWHFRAASGAMTPFAGRQCTMLATVGWHSSCNGRILAKAKLLHVKQYSHRIDVDHCTCTFWLLSTWVDSDSWYLMYLADLLSLPSLTNWVNASCDWYQFALRICGRSGRRLDGVSCYSCWEFGSCIAAL